MCKCKCMCVFVCVNIAWPILTELWDVKLTPIITALGRLKLEGRLKYQGSRVAPCLKQDDNKTR